MVVVWVWVWVVVREGTVLLVWGVTQGVEVVVVVVVVVVWG